MCSFREMIQYNVGGPIPNIECFLCCSNVYDTDPTLIQHYNAPHRMSYIDKHNVVSCRPCVALACLHNETKTETCCNELNYIILF